MHVIAARLLPYQLLEGLHIAVPQVLAAQRSAGSASGVKGLQGRSHVAQAINPAGGYTQTPQEKRTENDPQ
jgi:hypothetical protein